MSTNSIGYTDPSSTFQSIRVAPSSGWTALSAESACQTLHRAGVGNVCKQIEANARFIQYQTQFKAAIGPVKLPPPNRHRKTELKLLMDAFFDSKAIFERRLHAKYNAALEIAVRCCDKTCAGIETYLESNPGIVHVWVDANDLQAVFVSVRESFSGNGGANSGYGGYAPYPPSSAQLSSQSEAYYAGTHSATPTQPSQLFSPYSSASTGHAQLPNNFDGYFAPSSRAVAAASTVSKVGHIKAKYDMLTKPQTFKSVVGLPPRSSVDVFANGWMKSIYESFFKSTIGKGFTPSVPTFADRLRTKCKTAVHAVYNEAHGKDPKGPIYWEHYPEHREHFEAWLNENPGVFEVSVDADDVDAVFRWDS